MDLSVNTIICGDCLEVMKDWPDNCVDLVLTDPPYGTTGNSWDVSMDLSVLLTECLRVSWHGVVCTASQPFTTDLISAGREVFKYCWVWNKCLAGNGILAKKQPLKIHEDICVFGPVRYFPQMRKGQMRLKGGIQDKHGTFGYSESGVTYNDDYYPESILIFSGAAMRSSRQHPTEKPVELFGYLTKTYTAEGDLILDPFCGSGTTCVAAKMLGRRFIGIDISEKYCEIARMRLKAVDTGVPVAGQKAGQMGLFEANQ